MLIIFDLDDTLVDTTGSILPHRRKRALRAMVDAGLEIESFEKALSAFDVCDENSESSSATLKKFLGKQKKFYAIGYEKIYASDLFDFPIQTTPSAFEVLQQLQNHHKLALVTYGIEAVQKAKMKKTGLDSRFFSTIVVTKSGNKKPHYQTIFEAFGGPASDVIVVGDRIASDLTPAKELGFRTVQIKWGRGKNSEPHPQVDYTINNLKELMPLVEEKIEI